MVSKWHHRDDPPRVNDLLGHLRVAEQELSGKIELTQNLLTENDLKSILYRDLLIFLARKSCTLHEISKIVGVPVRTLRHQLRRMFKAPENTPSP